MTNPDDAFVDPHGALLVPRRRWAIVGGALLGGVPVLAAIAFATGIYPLLVGTIHFTLFGLLALAYARGSHKGAKPVPGELRVTADEISLGDQRLARRDELASGFVVPSGAETHVRLERRARYRRPIWVRVHGPAEGHALLRALGFDAGQAVGEMKIATGMLAMSLGKQLAFILPAALGMSGAMSALAALLLERSLLPTLAVAALFLAYVFTLAFSPTRVRVGVDGVSSQWLGRARFIPFSSVRALRTYNERVGSKAQRGVRLELVSGEVVKLPTGQTDIGDTEAARLAQRIEEARRFAHSATGAVPVGALARRERAPVEWVRDLKRIGAGANAGPRTAPVSVDELLRVVGDATAPPLDRASAAIAAAQTGDAAARRRIRLATETTVSPRLRVALERANDEASDEAALAEALAALEEPATREARGADEPRR